MNNAKNLIGLTEADGCRVSVRLAQRASIVRLTADGLENKIKQNVEPGKEVHVHRICDNDATHKHPQVLARAKRNKRFHFHFTPTGASWLNMIERLFGDLDGKALKRGSFTSVNDLIGAIHEYINAHNADPKPIIWTASANDTLAKVKRAQKAANKL